MRLIKSQRFQIYSIYRLGQNRSLVLVVYIVSTFNQCFEYCFGSYPDLSIGRRHFDICLIGVSALSHMECHNYGINPCNYRSKLPIPKRRNSLTWKMHFCISHFWKNYQTHVLSFGPENAHFETLKLNQTGTEYATSRHSGPLACMKVSNKLSQVHSLCCVMEIA